MNKQGSTLANWILIIVPILLFIIILQTAVLNPMNDIYNKSYSTGLETSNFDDFESLRQTSHAEMEGSEVESSSEGFNFLSGWKIGKGVYQVIVNFIDGTFINNLVVDVLGLPVIIARTITILIWISLILIILGIFFKWWI
jgi:hypothetical protein